MRGLRFLVSSRFAEDPARNGSIKLRALKQIAAETAADVEGMWGDLVGKIEQLERLMAEDTVKKAGMIIFAIVLFVGLYSGAFLMTLYALMIFFFPGAVAMLIIGKTSAFFFSEWSPRALAILSFVVYGTASLGFWLWWLT